jgi:hypothetical protein
VAHVHLWIVTFTVRFGSSGGESNDKALEWPDFAPLLPATTTVVTVLPASGVTKMLDAPNDPHSTSGKLWVARAVGLSFSTQSAVPASQLSYGSADEAHPADVAGDGIDIRPMNLTGVGAVHELTIRKGSPNAKPLDVSSWSLTPRTENMPDSLWGAPPQPFSQIPSQPDAKVLPGTLVGYDVVVPDPVLGPTPGVVAISEYAEEPLPPGTQPLDPDTPPTTDYVPVADPTSVAAIAAVEAAAPARNALVTALTSGGVYAGANDALDNLAAAAGHSYADPPMLEGAAP